MYGFVPIGKHSCIYLENLVAYKNIEGLVSYFDSSHIFIRNLTLFDNTYSLTINPVSKFYEPKV